MNRLFYVTAPLLVCFLLAVTLLHTKSAGSRGEYVFLAETENRPVPTYGCGDGRKIIVYLASDGSTQINSDVLREDEFNKAMVEIFRTRAEKVMFIAADRDVPFGNVAAQIGHLHATIEHLNIALLPVPIPRGGCGPTIRHWEKLDLR